MLSTVMDVLLGVHKGAIMGWGGPHDVRAVLDAERRRVLAGVRLTFSRVIPLEQEPSTHPLWQLAERFGATCSTVVGDDVTHVVAVTDGTDKVCMMWNVLCTRECVTECMYDVAQHTGAVGVAESQGCGAAIMVGLWVLWDNTCGHEHTWYVMATQVGVFLYAVAPCA